MKDEGGRMSQIVASRMNMAASPHLGILSEPLQPGLFRQCIKCLRLFAIELMREEDSELSGKLRTFRCKYCGHEQVFAEQHPPDVV
jgi:DNA-directed RNA polymerase subunit RPC12/RpoP